MTLELREEAVADLEQAAAFYEKQEKGMGAFFEDRLLEDLEHLRVFRPLLARKFLAFQRTISARFPYAIYFSIEGERILIHAVLDCRRHPAWTRKKLKKR